jgi:hypothetical protein
LEMGISGSRVTVVSLTEGSVLVGFTITAPLAGSNEISVAEFVAQLNSEPEGLSAEALTEAVVALAPDSLTALRPPLTKVIHCNIGKGKGFSSFKGGEQQFCYHYVRCTSADHTSALLSTGYV